MSMKSSKIEAEKVIGALCHNDENSFTDKDSILYALGIGFSTDPMKTEDYKYTSEFDDQFQTFPTYITCLCNINLYALLSSHQSVPEFSPYMILHAQERIEMFKPLKPGINYTNKAYVTDIIDKGKMALVTATSKTTFKNNDKEELAATRQTIIAIKGLGGFGYKGNGTTLKIPERPTRNSDFTIEAQSYPGQAFLYRLSGDRNPLHIKPDIAAVQSFPQPIIHGLASYGIIARALIQTLFKNNANVLKVYHVRFVGHVFPGEKYKIEVWKENGYYWFRAVVVERNKECIIGYLTLQEGAKL